MRIMSIAMLVVSLGLAGCATKAKPGAAASACPPLKVEQWAPIVRQAMLKTFGAELWRRFNSTGIHILVDQAVDTRGDIVFTAQRIGPSKFEMPEAGKGGAFRVVLAPCTAKVLKVRKLSDLEAEPKVLAPSEDAGA